MAFDPSLEEQQLHAETFRREQSRLTGRELVSEIALALGFTVATAALWLIYPPSTFALAPAALCMVVLAVASRVRIDTPFGYTHAAQLAFVPLLFAIPPAVVPIAVVAAFTIALLPDLLAGKARPGRLLVAVGNSWFAIGPAAVFALAKTEPRDAGPALLIAALTAQCTVDFAVSALRFWIDREASLKAQLRETWVYAIDAALSGVALVVAEDMDRSPAAVLALLPLLGVLAVFAHERHQRVQGLLELNNAYRGTALVLGDVLEADDGYTGEHCRSVVQLALALGEKLGLGAEQARNLEFAALLHDIGKIAIPTEIINKPGKLDPDEWRIIKTHTLEGQRMLDQVGGFMQTVGLIVRSHHERWDGRGYPDGLAGEAIPFEARIIACCDSWNAMRTDRAYRPALSHEIALAELLANTGHQFDPHIVPVFLTVIESTPQHRPITPPTPNPHGAPTAETERHATAP